MEEKLVLIGVGMGLYAWLLRKLLGRKTAPARGRVIALHAAFWAVAGAALVLLYKAGFGRGDLEAASQTLASRAAWPCLFGAVAGLGWGVYEARGAKDRAAVLRGDLEWADTISSSVLLAAVLIYCILQAFVIPSGSMENTLLVGDHLFVNKFLYGVRVPFTAKRVLKVRDVRRGDIIVFQFPSDDPAEDHCGGPQTGKDFIKRAVAVGGDVVRVKDGELFVNGKHPDEPYAVYSDPERLPAPLFAPAGEAYQDIWQSRRLDAEAGDLIRDNFGPVTVPQGDVFAMGDNRDRSCDSRFWGPVPERYLKGKAWFLYWPLDRLRVL